MNRWFLDNAEIIKDFARGFIEKLEIAVRFVNSSWGRDDSGIEDSREKSASFLDSETDKHLPIYVKIIMMEVLLFGRFCFGLGGGGGSWS